MQCPSQCSQASALEEELGRLAESAGRRDAKRERELQQEVERLRALMQNGTAVGREDELIAYVSDYPAYTQKQVYVKATFFILIMWL